MAKTKEYWRTKRCHVVLSKFGNKIAIGTLQDLTTYRDRFINACAHAGGLLDYVMWDYEYIREWRERYPTLENDLRLGLLKRTSATLEKMERRDENVWDKFLTGGLMLPPEKYIDIVGRGGIGFRTEDGQPTTEQTEWIYVPYFGQAKLRRKYLSQQDFERTHYMQLRHYPDSGEWFLLLKIKVEYGYKATELQNRELMPALAVSFGVDTLVTTYDEYSNTYSEYVNVAIDEESMTLLKRIHEIEDKLHRQIIGTAHQMGYLTDDPHFDVRDMTPADRKTLETGRRYLQTRRLLGRLKRKYANRKYVERNHIMKEICRGDWRYVVLDTTDRGVHLARQSTFGYPATYLSERIEQTGLDILADKIKAECADRALPYYQVTPKWTGWKRCSKCNKLNTFERLENGEVKCKNCGYQTLPHVNNCINLMRYGQSASLGK